MLFKLLKRWSGKVIFEADKDSLRLVVEAAVEQKVILTGADLRDADLRGADLTDAVLTDAVLRGADLTDAVLTDAVLRGADLRDADLTGADLTQFRDDFWAVLSSAPAEVPALREALIAGKIDGSTYHGECSCLVGTIAKARGCDYRSVPHLTPDSRRLAETWFTRIKPGDTPETNEASLVALEWTDTWLAGMRAAFGPKLVEAAGDMQAVADLHAKY